MSLSLVDFDEVITKLVRMSAPTTKPVRHLTDIPQSLYKPGEKPMTEIEASWNKLTARSEESEVTENGIE